MSMIEQWAGPRPPHTQLWILLYEHEWSNHRFLYHSLLPFCIKGCACVLKWVMPATPICNTKYPSSGCWLVLAHGVKEPCLRDSHTTRCFPVVLHAPFSPEGSTAQGDSTELPVKIFHQTDQRCSPVIPEWFRQMYSYASNETLLFDRTQNLSMK